MLKPMSPADFLSKMLGSWPKLPDAALAECTDVEKEFICRDSPILLRGLRQNWDSPQLELGLFPFGPPVRRLNLSRTDCVTYWLAWRP